MPLIPQGFLEFVFLFSFINPDASARELASYIWNFLSVMNIKVIIFPLVLLLLNCQVFAKDHAAAFEEAAAAFDLCDSFSSGEAVILMREIALRTGNPTMLYRASVASAKSNRNEEAIFLFLVAKFSDPSLTGEHIAGADERILPLLMINPGISRRILGKATQRLESAGIVLKPFPLNQDTPRDLINTAEKSSDVRLDAARRYGVLHSASFWSKKNRCPGEEPSRRALDSAMDKFGNIISELVKVDHQIIARSGLPIVKGFPTRWSLSDGKPRIAEVHFWDKDKRYFSAIYEIDVAGDKDHIYTFGAKIRLACITDIESGNREARDATWGCASDPLSIPGEQKVLGRWDYQ